MKRKYFYLLIILLGMISCSKDYQGDSFDFSNTTNPYIELKAVKIAVSAPANRDTTFSITVRLRTAIATAPTTVNYQLSGALSGTGSVVIERNKIEGTKAGIIVPAGVLPVGVTSATATVTLTSATNPNVVFDLGRNNVGKTATVTIKPL